MRRTVFFLICVSFLLIVVGSSAFLINRAAANSTSPAQAPPGTRCTRLTFGPKPKKGAVQETGFPGSRCARLAQGGKPKSILPNTPPKIGLATSASYLPVKAPSQVQLKSVACDADGDTLLYTYSATAGRITGNGQTAIWDLNGVSRPGTYTVTVEVDDGCGCIAFDSSEVTLE